MATNRADTLDPALLRPGRLDRKIEFPMPDRRQKRLIFATITGKMNLSDEVDLEDYVARPDRISGADINAIVQEVRTRGRGPSEAEPKVKGRTEPSWPGSCFVRDWGHVSWDVVYSG